MTSRRLRNDDRDLVVRRLLIHAFREPADDLIRDMRSHALGVYQDLYTAGSRDKMSALPEGWLPTANNVEVRFGSSSYLHLRFDGTTNIGGSVHKVCTKREALFLRMLSRHIRRCAKVYDDDHALSSTWRGLVARRDALKKSIEEAEGRARAILNSVTTTNRLVEVWPEVKPYLDQPREVKLPAVPVQEVNELLNLGGGNGRT